jgi:V/A-type H+-transporting ATPase subunit C
MKKNLLGKADYDKLIKMSPEEIGKYLEDFEYKREVDELALRYKGVELIERTLQLNLGNKFEKLRRIAPHDLRLLITVYMRRYDVYNIKTILRGKFSLLSVEEIQSYLSPVAMEPAPYFDKLLAQKTVEEVFSAVEFVEEKEKRAALDHFKSANTLVHMENALDRYYYSYVFSQLRYLTMEGRLYKRFLLNEIDVLNIKIVLRLKQEKLAEQATKDLVFSYGTIKKESVDRMLKADMAGIFKELEASDFKEAVDTYSKDPEKMNLAELEISLDKFLLQQSKKLTRQHPMSVDVILGYMFLKDIEVKNLAKIIKAKQLGLPESFINNVVVV